MDYLTFRSNALSSVALTRNSKKNRFPPNHWSKDDLEKWVKSEYDRLYSNQEVKHG